ncbi:hypothetical protein EDB86DRAFT_2834014 [Lactarius hatsudake]|nr:hypothetical protein EDB86DRAFT_2834014 [Lactarius hatsudake]
MVAQRQPSQEHPGGDNDNAGTFVLVVPDRFVRKCIAPALPPHLRTSRGRKARDLTTPSTTAARPLPLRNPDDGAKSSSCSQTTGARHLPLPPRLHPSRGVIIAELMNWGARAISELAGAVVAAPAKHGQVDRPVATVASARACASTRTTDDVPDASVDQSSAGAIRRIKVKVQLFARARVSATSTAPVGSSRGVWGVSGGGTSAAVHGGGRGRFGRDVRRPCAPTAVPHSKNPANSLAVAPVAFCVLDLEDQASVQVAECARGDHDHRWRRRERAWTCEVRVKRYGQSSAMRCRFLCGQIGVCGWHFPFPHNDTGNRSTFQLDTAYARGCVQARFVGNGATTFTLALSLGASARVSTKRRILPLGTAGADAEAAALGFLRSPRRRWRRVVVPVSVTLAGVKFRQIDFWRGGRGASLTGHTGIRGRGASGGTSCQDIILETGLRPVRPSRRLLSKGRFLARWQGSGEPGRALTKRESVDLQGQERGSGIYYEQDSNEEPTL